MIIEERCPAPAQKPCETYVRQRVGLDRLEFTKYSKAFETITKTRVCVWVQTQECVMTIEERCPAPSRKPYQT